MTRLYDTWVFGRTTGSTLHAAMNRTGSLPNSYFTTGLCPARDAQGILRAFNEPYDPDTALAEGRTLCPTCERRWRANHGPQSPDNKTCVDCGTTQSVSQFHRDSRTRDGHAKTCFTCVEAAHRARKASSRALADADELQDALDEATRRQTTQIEALATFQNSDRLPAYLCEAGHTLTPVPGLMPPSAFGRWSGVEWPNVEWSCACGTEPVDDDQWPFVFDAVKAVALLDSLAAPEPVKVA